jgi:hypothetical protein
LIKRLSSLEDAKLRRLILEAMRFQLAVDDTS